jgi:hypothetical protein
MIDKEESQNRNQRNKSQILTALERIELGQAAAQRRNPQTNHIFQLAL